MTRDEILNMPAGFKMDILIAEKVFDYPEEVIRNNGFKKDGDWMVGTIKPYSTDIAAAWEVVDKAYITSLRRVVNNEPDTPALWQAFIYADPNLSGIASTAPLAICRAALLATLK